MNALTDWLTHWLIGWLIYWCILYSFSTYWKYGCQINGL